MKSHLFSIFSVSMTTSAGMSGARGKLRRGLREWVVFLFHEMKWSKVINAFWISSKHCFLSNTPALFAHCQCLSFQSLPTIDFRNSWLCWRRCFMVTCFSSFYQCFVQLREVFLCIWFLVFAKLEADYVQSVATLLFALSIVLTDRFRSYVGF